MGSQKLGDFPRTHRFNEIVELIQDGEPAATIAGETLNAAAVAIGGCVEDPAFQQATWLLVQLPYAATRNSFSAALADLGVDAPDHTSLMALVSAVHDSVDEHCASAGGRTDLGTMASDSLAETLVASLAPRVQGLFGATHADLVRELGSMSRGIEFGNYARRFFGRLSERIVGYHLSRKLTDHIGRNQRFRTLRHHTRFQEALDQDAKERSRYVQDMCTEWLGKTRFEQGGVSREAAAKMAYGALMKMTTPLQSEVA